MGGYARRAGFIDSIRKHEKNVLLLDAGDYLQGTPYFNFFKGDVEIAAINAMKYDAITIGNHEFDNGVSALADVLSKSLVPIVCSNYKVTGTPLDGLIKPYLIIKRRGIKIGIIGLGIQPRGLITETNFYGIHYLDPIAVANNYGYYLKKKAKCDVVICLSHLGHDTKGISDIELVKRTENIDLVIGGHTHKLLDVKVPNLIGDTITIVQAGKSGAYLGRVDLSPKKTLGRNELYKTIRPTRVKFFICCFCPSTKKTNPPKSYAMGRFGFHQDDS